MVEWVEARQRFKQPFESQTSLFQKTYIRFAVGHQFFLEVKDLLALLLMPLFQGLLAFGRHGFGHVVIEGRDGSHVRLMFWKVKLVWEVTFAEFCQSKVLGKADRGIWKKRRESMKRMRSCWTSKSLHPFRSCSTIRLSP